jgi:protein-L-isoaspartate O-methyltransferase
MNRRKMLLAGLGALPLAAQEVKKGEKLAPYYPTPELIVEKMITLGGGKKGEKVFDLGSGDGRIVIIAAEKFGMNAVGVEYDKDLYSQSSEKIRRMGLSEKAKIIHGDLLQQDYTSADLITVYLLPVANDKLRPILEKQLKKGARVVAHDFEVGGWRADKTEVVEDDGEGRSHTLYLYKR